MAIGKFSILKISIIAAILIVILFYSSPWIFNHQIGGGAPVSLMARIAMQRGYSGVSPEEESGFLRLDPENPDGWLAIFPETPQTMELYKATCRIRPSPERRTIVLQPLGELDSNIHTNPEILCEYIRIFYQLPCRIAKPIPLTLSTPEGNWSRKVRSESVPWAIQYDSSLILDRILLPNKPKDALAYFGITIADLFVYEMSFVFGLGSLDRGVGVLSLCRFSPRFYGRNEKLADRCVQLRRSCKMLNHEIGHLLGLTHCVFYCCSMNGANSLSEADSSPMEYCPICFRKLMWNIGFDATKRFEEMNAFYTKNGLVEESRWISKRIEQWKSAIVTSSTR